MRRAKKIGERGRGAARVGPMGEPTEKHETPPSERPILSGDAPEPETPAEEAPAPAPKPEGQINEL